MGRGISVQVGDVTYPSKKAAIDEAKRIRDKYIPFAGTPITDPADVAFLHGYIQNHPGVEKKIGVGVAHFYVGLNIADHCLWIKRIDGTTIDFSITGTLCDDETLKRRQQTSAFRAAIDEQIEAFRLSAFGENETVVCALSNCKFPEVPLTASEAHVDHVFPFSMMVPQFLLEAGLGWVEVKGGGKGSAPKIRDASIRNQWREYHQMHAKLRVIHKGENMSRGNRSVE